MPDRLEMRERSGPKSQPSGFEQDLLEALDAEQNYKVHTWQHRRDKVRRTLAALQHVFGQSLVLQDHAAREDLALLILALKAENSGYLHPLLKPLDSLNRLPDHAISVQFRRIVLQCVDLLIASGSGREDAFRFVSSELDRRGVPPLKAKPGEPSSFKASTIKRWWSRTRPGRDGNIENEEDAAFLERMAVRHPVSLAEAKAEVRTWLDQPIVRAMSPKGAKPTF